MSLMDFIDENSLKKQVFDTTPIPIVVMDADSLCYIDCNLAAVEIYGCSTKDALIGKKTLDFSAPLQYDGRPSAEKAGLFATPAGTQGAIVFEWRHCRPDGEQWDGEVHLRSFSIGGKQLLQVSLVDITARKSSERLTSLLHDLILDLNSCNDIHIAFDRVLSSLLTLEDLDCGGIYLVDPADHSLHLIYHRGLSASFVAQVSHYDNDSPNVQLVRSGKPLYGDYNELNPVNDPILDKEGLHSMALIPIRAEGSLIALMNCASHTSDEIPASTRNAIETIAFHIGGSLLRIRTNEALRESALLFEAFMENMPSMVIIKDEQLRPRYFNKRFLDQFPSSGRIGKTAQEPASAEVADVRSKADREALATGPICYEETCVDKNKSIRTLETRKFPIKRSGTSPHLGVIINDVTDQRRVEQALHNTQKLESLGILAGGIAHDFNNLLGGVFGFIDLARLESQSETCTTYLSSAMTAIDRARALTLQLLTFSKGGAPVTKIEKLSPFIRDTVRFALSGTPVSCQYAIDGSLWECKCDKNQIGQAIDNIVINAVQATPCRGMIYVFAGNASVSDLRAHHLPPDSRMIHISVRDEGIGIPKEFLPRVFDPFFTTKPQGHGLGLATCFSIVHRHGGSIDVESEPGKGSTFHVFLPAAPDVSEKIAVASPSAHKGKGHFLVLDDEKSIQQTFSLMLKSFGYTAAIAAHGNEALGIATKAKTGSPPIDAMIFDITIPGGLGGKEIISDIRKSYPETPIFVSSGYADDPVMANPADYGFTASISKPFTLAELAAVLNHYLPSGAEQKKCI
jgi:PAS domain S-box-containing protein